VAPGSIHPLTEIFLGVKEQHFICSISFHLMQMACHSILSIALLQPYTFSLIGFQAILLVLLQNRKWNVIHILAYLPYLDKH
jgi:hypothetical protein